MLIRVDPKDIPSRKGGWFAVVLFVLPDAARKFTRPLFINAKV